jgi:ABC-type nitrate/sulfonate/bicarbonate transport system ATPase subunit
MSSRGPAIGAALEMEGVGFSYPERTRSSNNTGPLYENFSLRVEQGSIVAIMGASGSGKTTLGRMMAGILSPQAGTISWSADFKKPSDIVYVDQHPINSVFPWQTTHRNIQYPLRKLAWDRSQQMERACHLVSLFRLGGLAQAYPAQLSGGELQRLALARGLSWRPELVILDEPFSALDGKVKAEITAALHELALGDRITLVLITHNIADALALGMRCVVIGQRPVRLISDLEFRKGFPRQEGTADYEAMQQALIAGIRSGLV